MTRLFAQFQGEDHDRYCTMAKLIDNLDDVTKEVMLKVLMDPSYGNVAIHAELKISGYKMGRDTMTYHRNRMLGLKGKTWCHCPDEKEIK